MSLSRPLRYRFLKNCSEIGIVAAGFAGGQARQGVKAAPKVIMKSNDLLGYIEKNLGFTVFFDNKLANYSNLKPKEDADFRRMKQPRYVSAATQQISQQVYAHASQGRLVLTIGGDHSIGIGTVTGIAKAVQEQWQRNIGVIWVDAHADINTPETSPSGRIHGMPVAFATQLAKEQKEDIFGWIQSEHKLEPRKLVYIGLRDLDQSEKLCIRENNIKAFTMRDVDQLGIARVMEETIAYLGRDCPIHLCFDIDAIDPSHAPSTGFPVPGGLTLREGEYIAHAVATTGSLVAIDLVEVNPEIKAKRAKDTINVACSIIKTALGHTLL